MFGGNFCLMCLPELFKFCMFRFFFRIQEWKGYGLSPVKGRRQRRRRGCGLATVQI
jgi:hypothetical protein